MTVQYNPDGTPIAHDALGNSVNIGDKVIYSAADGRSSVLRRGVVKDIYVKHDSYRPNSDHIKLSVESERARRGGAWQPIHRVVHLSFLERVVVLDSNAW